ncbi:MAG: hypothetical protein KDE52_08120, partial [Calditrichaeota bacterium]|nr:hypothetical protein [Calditrichota bacterium]
MHSAILAKELFFITKAVQFLNDAGTETSDSSATLFAVQLMVKWKMEPAFTSLSTHIFPPINSQIFL